MKLFTHKGIEIDNKSDTRKLIDFQMEKITNKYFKKMAESMYGPNPFDSLINQVIITDKYGDEIARSKGEPVTIKGLKDILEPQDNQKEGGEC